MPKSEQYRANLDFITPLISRNRENIQVVTATSFWVNDVKQANSAHAIEVRESSKKNWLKFEQTFGEECSLFPVDGSEGVFIYPPPVNNIDDFKIENSAVGGCDFLILNNIWHFAEFKIEATSQNIEQIKENRTKASLQLARTLTYFKEKLPESAINSKNAECLIIAPIFYPKISALPIAMTSRFLRKFGVKLAEKTLDEVIKL